MSQPRIGVNEILDLPIADEARESFLPPLWWVHAARILRPHHKTTIVEVMQAATRAPSRNCNFMLPPQRYVDSTKFLQCRLYKANWNATGCFCSKRAHANGGTSDESATVPSVCSEKRHYRDKRCRLNQQRRICYPHDYPASA